jgi:TrfA protein
MPKTQSTNPLAALEKLRQSRSRKAPGKKASPPQMSLPLWPEAVRGIPNAILRGALFSVTQRRPMFRKLTLLTTVDGIEIRFRGEGFNQTDLDLCEMLLHLARQQPLGRRVEFTARSVLKALGRGTGKTQHEQLKEEISRLASGLIEISWPGNDGGRLAFGGTLVKYGRDEQPDGTHRHVVMFDEQLLRLYEAGYSHIDWHQRQALGANNLAKWLHGFYATHAEPLPYKVETIKGLCGSTVERLGDFRKLLRKALDELEAIGAIKGYGITDGDLVVVTKVPTLSQQRHLRRRLQ